MKLKRHQFHTDSGKKMNAHFDVHDGHLILCSRGGAKGTSTEQNTDYSPALLLLLQRIEKSELDIDGIWVDSNRVQKLPLKERLIFHDEDLECSPYELRSKLFGRIPEVGRSSKSNSRGNPTKRIRFAFTGNALEDRIAQFANRGEADDLPVSPEDRVWIEGSPRRTTHLRRERNSRAVREKKEAFRIEHGRLKCEECGVVPEDVYESYGDACIEVHHKQPLSDLPSASETRLEDLMCVCANCHRILHQKLRDATP